MKVEVIHNKIHEIRGEKVMLDFDLAELYQTETKYLKRAVKANIKRFPKDFMFVLTRDEFLRCNISTSKRGGTRYMPFAFTEHGITMLAAVLNSDRAIEMNIAIVRAFISLKKLANKSLTTTNLIKELKQRIDEHDVQLNSIYDVIENLLDKKIDEELKLQQWEERQRIGFKK